MIDDADLARALVRDAGKLALRMRVEGLKTEVKSGVADVVTAADRAAEAYVVERLAEERPEDGVLGEEGAARAGTSGRTWVIDPVDGTYNFSRGLDWWCSALALLEGPAEEDADIDRVILGAVHHPAADVTFVGGPDLPTTRNGESLATPADPPLERACATTYLHPPFYEGDINEAFTRAVSGVATLRMLGSGTMDCTAIAQGSCDVLFQHSVPLWDRLPGGAIIRGVGGESRRISAAGVDWHVAGAPTCVAAVCASLQDR